VGPQEIPEQAPVLEPHHVPSGVAAGRRTGSGSAAHGGRKGDEVADEASLVVDGYVGTGRAEARLEFFAQLADHVLDGDEYLADDLPRGRE
jgi:hypothetical protein